MHAYRYARTKQGAARAARAQRAVRGSARGRPALVRRRHSRAHPPRAYVRQSGFEPAAAAAARHPRGKVGARAHAVAPGMPRGRAAAPVGAVRLTTGTCKGRGLAVLGRWMRAPTGKRAPSGAPRRKRRRPGTRRGAPRPWALGRARPCAPGLRRLGARGAGGIGATQSGGVCPFQVQWVIVLLASLQARRQGGRAARRRAAHASTCGARSAAPRRGPPEPLGRARWPA